MSRLYAITRTIDEIAAHFATDVLPVAGVADETIEGAPGLIVTEKDGLRLLKSLTWGIPSSHIRNRHNGGAARPYRPQIADLTNPL